MSKHVVTCIQRCWDSTACKRYYPGDTDLVESTEPIAKYFSGWPPGTEVYEKARGSKDKPVKESLRTVPGMVVEVEPPAPVVAVEPPAAVVAVEPPAAVVAVEPPAPPVTPAVIPPCDICGKAGWPSEASLKMHKVHCAKQRAAVP